MQMTSLHEYQALYKKIFKVMMDNQHNLNVQCQLYSCLISILRSAEVR
jgi:hypothetical protein